MKVFIDTNILIDFIARRGQFYYPAANLINLGIKGDIRLFATPLSYATCIFIAKKMLGYEGVVKAMQILDHYIQITTMTASQCHNALYSNMPEAACSRPDTSKPLDKPALEDRRTCIC